MSKLKSRISITVSENKVTCILEVNTLFQQITNWNREYWDLELETFESFLLYDDLKGQEWQELLKKSRKKDLLKTLGVIVTTGLLTFYLVTNLFEGGILFPTSEPVEGHSSVETGELFTSEGGSVQLTVPKDWKAINNLHEEAILQLGNQIKNKYLIVLDEPKYDFSSDITINDYAALVLEGMEQSAQNASVSEPVEVTINGYKGLQYELHGEVKKMKVAYHITLIETTKIFYQVIGWSLESNFTKNKDEFIAITSTLKSLGNEESSYLLKQ